MMLHEAKAHFRTGALVAAKVIPEPMGNGWNIGLAIQESDGIQPVMLESAREPVRRFGSVDAALRIIEDIGLQEFRVIRTP